MSEQVIINFILLIPQLFLLFIVCLSVKTMDKISSSNNEYSLKCLETQLRIEELRSKQVGEWIAYFDKIHECEESEDTEEPS